MGNKNTVETLRPIEWVDLQRWDLRCADAKFYRKEEVARAYEDHKRNLIAWKISPEDYIRRTALRNKSYTITPNLFGYNVSPGIKHFVFWTQSYVNISMDQAKKIVSSELRVLPRNIVIFENRPDMKSLPGLPHYQVFIKLT